MEAGFVAFAGACLQSGDVYAVCCFYGGSEKDCVASFPAGVEEFVKVVACLDVLEDRFIVVVVGGVWLRGFDDEPLFVVGWS